MQIKEKIGSFFPGNFDQTKPTTTFFLYEFDKIPLLTSIPFDTVFLFLDDRKDYYTSLQIWDSNGTLLINDEKILLSGSQILQGVHSTFYEHSIGASFRITTIPFTIAGGTYKATLNLYDNKDNLLDTKTTYFYTTTSKS